MKYEKTSSGTFFAEGRLAPPHAWHPNEDVHRLLPELTCPCGCGPASANYCEHGNCEEATLYLTFPCGAEGQLRMFEQGDWDIDIEPAEFHKEPFRCN